MTTVSLYKRGCEQQAPQDQRVLVEQGQLRLIREETSRGPVLRLMRGNKVLKELLVKPTHEHIDIFLPKRLTALDLEKHVRTYAQAASRFRTTALCSAFDNKGTPQVWDAKVEQFTGRRWRRLSLAFAHDKHEKEPDTQFPVWQYADVGLKLRRRGQIVLYEGTLRVTRQTHDYKIEFNLKRNDDAGFKTKLPKTLKQTVHLAPDADGDLTIEQLEFVSRRSRLLLMSDAKHKAAPNLVAPLQDGIREHLKTHANVGLQRLIDEPSPLLVSKPTLHEKILRARFLAAVNTVQDTKYGSIEAVVAAAQAKDASLKATDFAGAHRVLARKTPALDAPPAVENSAVPSLVKGLRAHLAVHADAGLQQFLDTPSPFLVQQPALHEKILRKRFLSAINAVQKTQYDSLEAVIAAAQAMDRSVQSTDYAAAYRVLTRKVTAPPAAPAGPSAAVSSLTKALRAHLAVHPDAGVQQFLDSPSPFLVKQPALHERILRKRLLGAINTAQTTQYQNFAAVVSAAQALDANIAAGDYVAIYSRVTAPNVPAQSPGPAAQPQPEPAPPLAAPQPEAVPVPDETLQAKAALLTDILALQKCFERMRKDRNLPRDIRPALRGLIRVKKKFVVMPDGGNARVEHRDTLLALYLKALRIIAPAAPLQHIQDVQIYTGISGFDYTAMYRQVARKNLISRDALKRVRDAFIAGRQRQLLVGSIRSDVFQYTEDQLSYRTHKASVDAAWVSIVQKAFPERKILDVDQALDALEMSGKGMALASVRLVKVLRKAPNVHKRDDIVNGVLRKALDSRVALDYTKDTLRGLSMKRYADRYTMYQYFYNIVQQVSHEKGLETFGDVLTHFHVDESRLLAELQKHIARYTAPVRAVKLPQAKALLLGAIGNTPPQDIFATQRTINISTQDEYAALKANTLYLSFRGPVATWNDTIQGIGSVLQGAFWEYSPQCTIAIRLVQSGPVHNQAALREQLFESIKTVPGLQATLKAKQIDFAVISDALTAEERAAEAFMHDAERYGRLPVGQVKQSDRRRDLPEERAEVLQAQLLLLLPLAQGELSRVEKPKPHGSWPKLMQALNVPSLKEALEKTHRRFVETVQSDPSQWALNATDHAMLNVLQVAMENEHVTAPLSERELVRRPTSTLERVAFRRKLRSAITEVTKQVFPELGIATLQNAARAMQLAQDASEHVVLGALAAHVEKYRPSQQYSVSEALQRCTADAVDLQSVQSHVRPDGSVVLVLTKGENQDWALDVAPTLAQYLNTYVDPEIAARPVYLHLVGSQLYTQDGAKESAKAFTEGLRSGLSAPVAAYVSKHTDVIRVSARSTFSWRSLRMVLPNALDRTQPQKRRNARNQRRAAIAAEAGVKRFVLQSGKTRQHAMVLHLYSQTTDWTTVGRQFGQFLFERIGADAAQLKIRFVLHTPGLLKSNTSELVKHSFSKALAAQLHGAQNVHKLKFNYLVRASRAEAPNEAPTSAPEATLPVAESFPKIRHRRDLCAHPKLAACILPWTTVSVAGSETAKARMAIVPAPTSSAHIQELIANMARLAKAQKQSLIVGHVGAQNSGSDAASYYDHDKALGKRVQNMPKLHDVMRSSALVSLQDDVSAMQMDAYVADSAKRNLHESLVFYMVPKKARDLVDGTKLLRQTLVSMKIETPSIDTAARAEDPEAYKRYVRTFIKSGKTFRATPVKVPPENKEFVALLVPHKDRAAAARAFTRHAPDIAKLWTFVNFGDDDSQYPSYGTVTMGAPLTAKIPEDHSLLVIVPQNSGITESQFDDLQMALIRNQGIALRDIMQSIQQFWDVR